ncbi:MAG: biotin/lipoyl-binding protein, partial [Cloacibacterium sp.]
MQLKSLENIYHINKKSNVAKWFLFTFLAFVFIMFLPWTQNIKTQGNVNTLFQEQRPQKLNSPIPGRIIKWYVKNGDVVKKGDTILQISEIKDDYLDPLLVERTQEQVQAKKGVREYYNAKISTTENQIAAITASKDLKLNQIKIKIAQLQNKLKAEQAELTAVNNELKIAQDQLNRQNKMYEEGLVSLT